MATSGKSALSMDAVLSGRVDLESYLNQRLQQAQTKPGSRTPPTTGPRTESPKQQLHRQFEDEEEDADYDEDELSDEEDIPSDLYDEYGLEEGEIPQGDFPYPPSQGMYRQAGPPPPHMFPSPRAVPGPRGPSPQMSADRRPLPMDSSKQLPHNAAMAHGRGPPQQQRSGMMAHPSTKSQQRLPTFRGGAPGNFPRHQHPMPQGQGHFRHGSPAFPGRSPRALMDQRMRMPRGGQHNQRPPYPTNAPQRLPQQAVQHREEEFQHRKLTSGGAQHSVDRRQISQRQSLPGQGQHGHRPSVPSQTAREQHSMQQRKTGQQHEDYGRYPEEYNSESDSEFEDEFAQNRNKHGHPRLAAGPCRPREPGGPHHVPNPMGPPHGEFFDDEEEYYEGCEEDLPPGFGYEISDEEEELEEDEIPRQPPSRDSRSQNKPPANAHRENTKDQYERNLERIQQQQLAKLRSLRDQNAQSESDTKKDISKSLTEKQRLQQTSQRESRRETEDSSEESSYSDGEVKRQGATKPGVDSDRQEKRRGKVATSSASTKAAVKSESAAKDISNAKCVVDSKQSISKTGREESRDSKPTEKSTSSSTSKKDNEGSHPLASVTLSSDDLEEKEENTKENDKMAPPSSTTGPGTCHDEPVCLISSTDDEEEEDEEEDEEEEEEEGSLSGLEEERPPSDEEEDEDDDDEDELESEEPSLNTSVINISVDDDSDETRDVGEDGDNGSARKDAPRSSTPSSETAPSSASESDSKTENKSLAPEAAKENPESPGEQESEMPKLELESMDSADSSEASMSPDLLSANTSFSEEPVKPTDKLEAVPEKSQQEESMEGDESKEDENKTSTKEEDSQITAEAMQVQQQRSPQGDKVEDAQSETQDTDRKRKAPPSPEVDSVTDKIQPPAKKPKKPTKPKEDSDAKPKSEKQTAGQKSHKKSTATHDVEDKAKSTPNDDKEESQAASEPSESADESMGENKQSSTEKKDVPQGDMQGNMPSGMQGNMYPGWQGNMPPGMPGNVPPGMQGNMPPGMQGNMPPGMQGNMPPGMQWNMPPNMQGHMPSDMQGNMPPGMQGNMPPGMQGNMSPGMQGNMPPGMQGNMYPGWQGNMPPGMQGNMPPGMQGSMPPSMQWNMQPGMQGSMPSNMMGSMPPGMQGNMPPGMQGNMPPGLQGNMPPGMQGNLPPAMSQNLPPTQQSIASDERSSPSTTPGAPDLKSEDSNAANNTEKNAEDAGTEEEGKKKGRKKKSPEQLAKEKEARKRKKEEDKLKTPEQLAEEKAEKERLRKEKKEQVEKDKEERARKKREREAMTPEQIAEEKKKKRKERNEKRAKERKEKKEQAKKRREETGESSDDEDKKHKKKAFERRNIRKIMTEDKLEEVTKTAQEEELERRKRVQEKERVLAELMKKQQQELEEKMVRQQEEFQEQLQKELEELEGGWDQEDEEGEDEDQSQRQQPLGEVSKEGEDSMESSEADLFKAQPSSPERPQQKEKEPCDMDVPKLKLPEIMEDEEDDEDEVIEEIDDEVEEPVVEPEEEEEEEEEDKAEKEKPKTSSSHLLSLLEDTAYKTEDEKDDEPEQDEKPEPRKEIKPSKPIDHDSDDVVEISDSDDDVVMLPSSEDEDEEIRRREEEEEEGEEDPENSGSHVNDAMNQPDAEGRVLVNVGHPPDEPDIFLAPQLSAAVKPHQIGGIRFLYDNMVESISQFKNSNGFGCILAHSMGLGKTIQLISFVDIVLRHTGAKTILCIVPVNTLQNWVAEFNMWIPQPDDPRVQGRSKEEVRTRDFKVNIITDNLKSTKQRATVVDDWSKNGGVLLMGYEMYRLLTSRRVLHKPKRRRKKGSSVPEIIDLEEEDRNQERMLDMHESLVKPGPDLVICDEGHRIKNSHASISQALKSIRTKRRVVLTGYPLQNNLMEYWCMVDFVRPNFLGTKTEFSNMFERPIMNGQCVDSTPQDSRLMRFRAHVLHSLLEGFVQRRGHAVLQASLPPKEEHVVLIRMSDIQRKLYTEFMHVINDSGLTAWANNNPIKAFSVCCKIWNHPDILHKIVQKEAKNVTEDNDLDIEDSTKADSNGKKGGKGKGGASTKPGAGQDQKANISRVNSTPDLGQELKPNLARIASTPNFGLRSEADSTTSIPEPSPMSCSGSLASIDPSLDFENSKGFDEFPKRENTPTVSMEGVEEGALNPASAQKQELNQDANGEANNPVKCEPKPDNSQSLELKPEVDIKPEPTSDVKQEPENKPETGQKMDTNEASEAQPKTSSDPATSAQTNNQGPKPAGESDGAKMGGKTESGQMQQQQEDGISPFMMDKKDGVITYDWAKDLMKDYMPGLVEHGGKMVMLMAIIEESLRVGEKILVFSQSLFTLSLIEEYLNKQIVPIEDCTETWTKNKHYFRLDGSTASMEREKLINQFNSPENKQLHVFLLSTRAGCLGINLVGANRVVVMDASWNPCHDSQAVCRVYRYGQSKRCYVYRLVTDNCMEKKIYDRQINKQGVADRVVDELNPQNYVRRNVDVLLQYEDKDLPYIDPVPLEEKYDDPVLKNVVTKHHHWITRDPFTHESLLIDSKETRLTKSEKRLAKQSYEMEKKMSIGYSRPSYSAFYPKGPGGEMLPNSRYISKLATSRPIASVRPMMSTPIPMHPRGPGMGLGLGGQPRVPVHLVRPGVSVQQVQTTTDIVIPGTNTTTSAGPSKIPAGENVLVIKTTKGVYIRTNTGRIFAVRSKGDNSPGGGAAGGLGGGLAMNVTGSKPSPPVIVSKPLVKPVTIGNKPYVTTTTMSGPRPGVKVVHIKPKMAGKGQEITIQPSMFPKQMFGKTVPGPLTRTTSTPAMSKPRTVMVVTATSTKTGTVNTRTASVSGHQIGALGSKVHKISISKNPKVTINESGALVSKELEKEMKKSAASPASSQKGDRSATSESESEYSEDEMLEEEKRREGDNKGKGDNRRGQGSQRSEVERANDGSSLKDARPGTQEQGKGRDSERSDDEEESGSSGDDDEFIRNMLEDKGPSRASPLLQQQRQGLNPMMRPQVEAVQPNQTKTSMSSPHTQPAMETPARDPGLLKPTAATQPQPQAPLGDRYTTTENRSKWGDSGGVMESNKFKTSSEVPHIDSSHNSVNGQGSMNYMRVGAVPVAPTAPTPAKEVQPPPSNVSSFSVANMISDSNTFGTSSNNDGAAKVFSSNDNTIVPPVNQASSQSDSMSMFGGPASNAVPVKDTRNQDEPPLGELSFGSMLGLLDGSDSPVLSGWNDMDTGTSGTNTNMGLTPTENTQQQPQPSSAATAPAPATASAPPQQQGQYPGSAFNKELPGTGQDPGGFNNMGGMPQQSMPAPGPGGAQYPYGNSHQFPWSGGPSVPPAWPSAPMNSHGYSSDMGGNYPPKDTSSSWMGAPPPHQPLHNNMMHSGMGYMGYPPPWGHHPYPQNPYMPQPPMYGSANPYSSWNYPPSFGSGVPPMPGNNPYGQNPSGQDTNPAPRAT